MKAFVTGGTGFIGGCLVRKLVQRGYQVNALVRSQRGASFLQSIGARPIWGDVTASASLSDGMQGCDLVFHLAAWYHLGASDQRKAQAVNIDGTRRVMNTAVQLGIPRILYTSTVAIYGDTHRACPDENYQRLDLTFLTEYERTKWTAYQEVIQPLIAQGAPVIVVIPGVVYGPGDPSLVGDMMRYFYRGLLPVFPGPELTLSFTYVDDVAEGHIQAAEHGVLGESYILAGPALSMGQAVQLWAQVLNRQPPLVYVPAAWIKPLIPLAHFLNTHFHVPHIISGDGINILGAAFTGCSDKASQQLGWRSRPLMEGLEKTFSWLAHTTQPVRLQLPTNAEKRRTLAWLILGTAFILYLLRQGKHQR